MRAVSVSDENTFFGFAQTDGAGRVPGGTSALTWVPSRLLWTDLDVDYGVKWAISVNAIVC
jgi:hypothetical protein